MYLSTLSLHGFKSFAEPTNLTFAPGVTAIVGPNGCGKSNIVDAVRWVIGEQRPTALRSEKMENVIFNGTAGRRALGMAEAQLTIENNRDVLPTEYTEVTIGRRLFRDGTSEYLMNGTQCRLKDITDLFMDTGMGAGAYSVIELKMIDDILSDSTEDRRRLFEEAAGITRYKLRRRQALRKLDSTQADLVRIRDLTDEVGKSVQRLQRQAEKAAAMQEHEARLHRLELALAQVEHDRLTAQHQAFQKRLGELQEEAGHLDERQAHEEKSLEALRRTLEEREGVLAERREALQTHRETLRRLEADERLEAERLQSAERDRDRTLREQEEAQEHHADLEQRAAHLEHECGEAEPVLHAAEERRASAEEERDRTRVAAEAKRQALQAFRQEEQTAEEARAGHQRALDRLTNRLELVRQEQVRTRERLGATDEEMSTLDDRLERAAAALGEARRAVEAARTALAEAEAERAERQEAVEEAAAALRRTERRRDAVEAEVQLLESLISSYEAFSDAVQFLAQDTSWGSGTFLTVADVLACDEADRLALDAALGDLASCIIVETDAEARQAVAQLRAAEKGQATFLVLDRLPSVVPADQEEGPALPLRRAVRVAEAKYEPLADALLRSIYLVDTLDEAEQQAASLEAPARYVARSGEWAGAGALLRGGHRQTGPSAVAGRIGRREQLEKTRARLGELDAAREDQQATLDERRAALEAVPHSARQDALHQAEERLAEAERKHERLRYEHEALSERRQDRTGRLTGLEEELATLQHDAAQVQERVHEAEEELAAARSARIAAEETFREAEATHRHALDHYNEASVAAVEARNRYANLRRDLDRTRRRLDELDARAQARTDELAALHQTIRKAQEKQAALQSKISALRAGRTDREDAVGAAQEALASARQDIAETEERLRALRQEREENMRAESQQAVRLAEVKTRREDLVESIREDFGQDLSEVSQPLPENFDEAEARREVSGLRKKIRGLGSVNPLALEEYEEESERLDFLTAQQEDLEQAEATLLETIDEINATAARRFEDTFEAIRKNFTRLFERLFGEGASARLQLENPGDLLESDVEIIAQPRGKKPSILAQLSSGEKTLTAIALLFAIYLVKPSPFCILDEVDAPLDDANTGRFMNLIREFEGETQFILVTHNKRTMELADRMYGITMQEQGVSKLVGVAFDEAVEIAEAA